MWHPGWLLFLSTIVDVGWREVDQHSQPVDISSSIRTSRTFAVSLEDALGEGGGCFDSDPRYNPQTVNCQTWLQWVLADAYSRGNRHYFHRNMDALRYYEEVSFAHRKHFIDRWILYDPGPLRILEHAECQSDRTQVIELQLSTFRTHHQYPMPLFEESVLGTEQHVVSYLSEQQSNHCLESLEVGWYVGFFVPNDKWLATWSSIGQMGLVHSMIVEKSTEAVFIHHASMDKKRVVSEPWAVFQKRLSVVAKGYRFFALEPTWVGGKTVSDEATRCQ